MIEVHLEKGSETRQRRKVKGSAPGTPGSDLVMYLELNFKEYLNKYPSSRNYKLLELDLRTHVFHFSAFYRLIN